MGFYTSHALIQGPTECESDALPTEPLGLINGLKQLKNLSIPQRLIRAMITKLFQAKIKLGQEQRAAKSQAIENLYKGKETNDNTKVRNDLDKRQRLVYDLGERQRLVEELHKPFSKPPQYSKVNFRSKDNIWYADLIIISKPESNYKYILTVMDGSTR